MEYSLLDLAEELIFRGLKLNTNVEIKNLSFVLKEIIYFTNPPKKELINLIEEIALKLGLISYLPNLDDVPLAGNLNRPLGSSLKSDDLFPPIGDVHGFSPCHCGMFSLAGLPNVSN